MSNISRVVTILTPVFGAVAALVVGWAARHAPGLPIPSTGEVTALEITGFVGAVGMAAHWLRGHQAWEARVAKDFPQLESDLGGLVTAVKKLDPKIVAEIEGIAQAEINQVLGKIVAHQASPAPAAPDAASA